MKKPLQPELAGALQNATLMFSQQWVCTSCGASRSYGLGVPERRSAWLLCDGECAPNHTLHQFRELRSVPSRRQE